MLLFFYLMRFKLKVLKSFILNTITFWLKFLFLIHLLFSFASTFNDMTLIWIWFLHFHLLCLTSHLRSSLLRFSSKKSSYCRKYSSTITLFGRFQILSWSFKLCTLEWKICTHVFNTVYIPRYHFRHWTCGISHQSVQTSLLLFILKHFIRLNFIIYRDSLQFTYGFIVILRYA